MDRRGLAAFGLTAAACGRIGFDGLDVGSDGGGSSVAFCAGPQPVADLLPQPGYIEDVRTPNGGTAVYSYFDFPLPSFDVWRHVSLDARLGPGALLTVTIDGSTVLSTPPAVTSGGELTAKLGVTYL